MKNSRGVLLLLAAATAACASWRWSGGSVPDGGRSDTVLRGVAAEESRHPAPAVASWDEAEEPIALSTAAPRPTPPPVPATPEQRAKEALFYSDMGPDSIDVSAYPAQQRYEYGVYSSACARCHTLARSVNSPLVGRGWWEFYMLGMRVRSRRAGRPLTKDETAAILDFLEYDSRVRKVEKAREFDALTEELKVRFARSIDERMRALQHGRTRVLRDPDR